MVPMKMKPTPYGMGDMDHGGGHGGDIEVDKLDTAVMM